MKNIITTTDTFNNKPQWRNAVAVVLGMFGILTMGIPWIYHMLVQVITMPREKWIHPSNKTNYPPKVLYPNKFCTFLCNVERIILYQLELLRSGFGREYCDEDLNKKQ